MSELQTRAIQKFNKRRIKYKKKLISFVRRTPTLHSMFSPWWHAQALKSPAKWLAATKSNLSHIQLPNFPEKTSLVLKSEFPRCAWQLKLTDGVNLIRHGTGVEKKNGSIFEGVWNGVFEDFDFDKADYVFGSGVRCGSDIIVTPPTHMFECIFFLYNKRTRDFISSNSLACCIAALPQSEQETWLAALAEHVNEINNKQTRRGFFGYNTKIMQLAQWELHWIYAHNLRLTSAAKIDIILRENNPSFNDFISYKNFMISILKVIVENGQSSHRQISLGSASCISTGYDSTAVSALAMNVGIDNALTLSITVNDKNDCGDDVARQLGMKCQCFSHPAGKSIDNLHMNYNGDVRDIASEFIGTIGFGDDILYAAFENVLENKMLFDGKAGDGAWAIDCLDKEGLPVTTTYSKSLNEFRLRVGFAHIPAPAIGADFPESLARISRSKEMKSYSIGGKYDRPIPRRIVEDAGVKRESFGQEKKAANPHPLNLHKLKYEALRNITKRYSAK